ncbi:hypothetical protein [Polymorphospora rubra]|uniref:hypothetical protein n=1 Tax=Polymorphospora rubra TaxID=338584 RepID=UPI001BB41D03|nr:hypothetical protein [Polymorphospora rubra]
METIDAVMLTRLAGEARGDSVGAATLALLDLLERSPSARFDVGKPVARALLEIWSHQHS